MATFNLYEDNKGKVTKESDGVKTYELEQIDDITYLIKGATMDIGSLFILEQPGADIDTEIIRALYIIEYVGVGNNVDFYRLDSTNPKFPQYLNVLEETPTGLLVSTGGEPGEPG